MLVKKFYFSEVSLLYCIVAPQHLRLQAYGRYLRVAQAYLYLLEALSLPWQPGTPSTTASLVTRPHMPRRLAQCIVHALVWPSLDSVESL